MREQAIRELDGKYGKVCHALSYNIVRNLSLKRYYHKEAAKRNSTYEIAMQELEAHFPAPLDYLHLLKMTLQQFGLDKMERLLKIL